MTVTSLDTRRVTLGGSTIAAACGVDPYTSPIRLWLEMTGRVTREPNEAMEWGNRLQPVIFAALRDMDYDVQEQEPCDEDARHFPDMARPWLVGHPDGWIQLGDHEGVVEAKASARGYDAPPPHYVAQVQTYLHLTALDVGVLATLAMLRLDVREIERDQRQIDLLLELAERFMGYVHSDTQPPPEGHPDDRAAILELYPDARKDVKVRETREVRDARRELLRLMEREKAQKARMEALRATITNHLKDADTLVSAHDETVATWKNTTTRRLDTARLRQSAPDVYEAFTTPQTTRRLLVS